MGCHTIRLLLSYHFYPPMVCITFFSMVGFMVTPLFRSWLLCFSQCKGVIDFTAPWMSKCGSLLLNENDKLAAQDVSKLDLPTMLLVMAESVGDHGPIVGEASLDIWRVMLASGVCTLVGCQWPSSLDSKQKNDQVLKDFYLICGQKETDRAKALRQAILRAMQHPGTEDVIHWGRFFVLGVP